MKTKLFFVMMISAILCISSVLAADTADNSARKEANLDARYNHLLCGINFINSRINALVANVPLASSLGSQKTTLTGDLSTLKGYADSNDKINFNSFVATTLRKDAKNAQDAIKTTWLNTRKNTTNEQKQAINSILNKSREDFASCNSNALKSIVGAKNSEMDNQIAAWNKDIENMKKQSFDTTEAEKVVSDANQLTSLLNDAASAATLDEMKQKIEDARQLHLHLWARFAIARLNSYIAKAEPAITATGKASELEAIKNLLSEASKTADPGHKYAEGEFKRVWGEIRQASEQLKTLLKEARDYKQSQRAANRGARKENNTLNRENGMANRVVRKTNATVPIPETGNENTTG